MFREQAQNYIEFFKRAENRQEYTCEDATTQSGTMAEQPESTWNALSRSGASNGLVRNTCHKGDVDKSNPLEWLTTWEADEEKTMKISKKYKMEKQCHNLAILRVKQHGVAWTPPAPAWLGLALQVDRIHLAMTHSHMFEDETFYRQNKPREWAAHMCFCNRGHFYVCYIHRNIKINIAI